MTRNQRITAGGQIRRKEQTRSEPEEKKGWTGARTGTVTGYCAEDESENPRAKTQNGSLRLMDRRIRKYMDRDCRKRTGEDTCAGRETDGTGSRNEGPGTEETGEGCSPDEESGGGKDQAGA